MKKIFNITLKCPICQNEFDYNIISFKARKECSKCQNDLIVRTRSMKSAFLSLPGFFIILTLREMLGISKMGIVIDLGYIVLTSLLFIGIVYKIVCKIKTPSYLYQVDTEDPTVLERHLKGQNKK